MTLSKKVVAWRWWEKQEEGVTRALWEVMDIFTILIVLTFYRCIHILKFIKFYTINRCLLHANYTIINQIFKETFFLRMHFIFYIKVIIKCILILFFLFLWYNLLSNWLTYYIQCSSQQVPSSMPTTHFPLPHHPILS